MPSDGLEQQFEMFRANYQSVDGKPFKHFHCPILHVDEPTELCKGHVINQAIPNSSRKWVVQRKDVDGFFGSNFESDVVAMLESEKLNIPDILQNKSLQKKFQTKLMIGEKEAKFYHDRGHMPDHHSPMELRSDTTTIQLVVQRPPEEMEEIATLYWQFVQKFDARLSALVTVLKAAHLTLFRLLKYDYGLSATSYYVGRAILGKFYLENRGKSPTEVKAAGLDYFQEYTHMVRPCDFSGDNSPKGTIDDGVMGMVFGESNLAFGYVVFVRTGHLLNSCMLPAVNHPNAIAEYLKFMESDQSRVRIATARIENDGKRLQMYGDPQEANWTKEDLATALTD